MYDEFSAANTDPRSFISNSGYFTERNQEDHISGLWEYFCFLGGFF